MNRFDRCDNRRLGQRGRGGCQGGNRGTGGKSDLFHRRVSEGEMLYNNGSV